MKKQEKRRRMASKMEHYISEYGPWIILLMVMVFLFLGAIFLMVSRWKL
jgi:choline-glycine betaine transporter